MERCDKKRSRQSKGFTIVEILAVVVILGILAGVAVPMVYRYVDKSKKQSYETMESTVYAGAKNYVLEQNMSLNSCASGYTDIETIGDNFLQDLQYVERLVDPNDKSKQCVYNVYGCEETEAAGDALATYKYKIELKCLDYTGCIVFHEDGTRVDCEMPNDETRGPDCGEQTPSINSWSNVDKLDIKLQCVDTTSGGCEKKVYTYTFTEEKAHQDVVIKDVFGNSTTCSINTYIDRTAPSKPVIDNPYENVWANKNYKIKVSSVDSLSGIKYFEYRYPNSSNEAERNWTQWKNSSKSKGDSTPFTTTDFSIERNEVVEIRACDYAENCSESSQSMIKIDKTKPTCTIVKNIANPNGSNGWYVSDITVSLDTSDVGGSAIAGYDLTTSTTPTYAFNKTASQGETSGVTYYGYVKDNANNVATCSSGVIKIDRTAPSKPVIDNPYENVWANKNYKIKVSSVDSLSGIKYFEYRYPNSSNEAERNWTQWKNSSKSKGDSTPFTTTDFSIERNEVVEIRACDYAENCSESSQSMIKIDKTKPTCTIVKNIANPNGSNGWYVSDITVSLDTSDVGGSAIAGYDLTTSTTPTYAFNKTASQGETSGVTYYGYVKDNANNVGTCSSGVIKVDKTPPSLTFSLSGNVSTATCSDSLSSVTQEKYTKNLSSSSLVHSVTCTNGAGLTSSNSKTYKYNACITGSPNECVGSYVRKWVGNATKTASGSCLCRGASTGHGYPTATGWCTTSGCGCPGSTWVIQNNCSIKYSCSSGTLSGSSCYSTVWDSCATTTNTCVAGYTG